MTISESVKNLPTNPGVYLMYDKEDIVIYVGKAKNLKNRVSSYFRKNTSHTPKVLAMIENIVRFEYIIVETEFEALVLECNLIKQYQPYYNILLKDDKAYPYIKITSGEAYPKIMLARKIKKDTSEYFGPYLNAKIINETIDTLKILFNIRSCNKILPRDIGKTRPCLNYQIGKCSAPCNNHISQEDYQKQFNKIKEFLNGNYNDVLNMLEDSMYDASEKMQFEKAAKIRDKIEAITQIHLRQKIASTSLGNKDVFGISNINDISCVVILIIRDGKIINRVHHIIKNNGIIEKDNILTEFIKQYYSMTDFIPKSIYTKENIVEKSLIEMWLTEKSGSKISINIIQKGENKRLCDMAENNAVENLKLHLITKDAKRRKMNDVIYKIKETLGLINPPMRIESYDISNISGVDSVGVCVVFENGMPKKSDYRIFNIKSVNGADDNKSIKETLYRRLENGIEGVKGFELPDLILIDGGKGHVSSAKEIMNFYKLDIPVFGMVKDDKHRTRGLTTEDKEISLKRTDSIFKFITQIQDETHRFAVKSFHKKHKNTVLKSELLNINGIGESKKNKLLKHFKSINKIKSATINELSKVIDKKSAENVFKYFNS